MTKQSYTQWREALEQIQNVKADLDKKISEVEEMKVKMGEVESANTSAQTAYQAAEEEKNAMAAELETVKSQLSSLQQEKANWQLEIDAKTDAYIQLQTSNNAEIQSVKELLEARNRQIEEMSKRQTEARAKWEEERAQWEEQKAKFEEEAVKREKAAVAKFKDSDECHGIIVTRAKGFFEVGRKHVVRRAWVDPDVDLSMEKLVELASADPYDIEARKGHLMVPYDENDLALIASDDAEDGTEPWIAPEVDPRNFDVLMAELKQREEEEDEVDAVIPPELSSQGTDSQDIDPLNFLKDANSQDIEGSSQGDPQI